MRLKTRLSLLLAAGLLGLCIQPVPATRAVEGPAFAKYAVAADHTEASAAGARVLAEGGNAADAAAATMLALGVVSPTSSGLGGGGFALYYRARDRKLTLLDFRETAPRKASPTMYAARAGDTPEQTKQRSQRGGLAVGVPGEPLGIAELVRRFGKKPLAAAVQPALQLAHDGFLVSDHTRKMLNFVREPLGRDPLLSAVFGPALAGETQAKNAALADTLTQFGKRGAKHFYQGAFAAQIVKTVQEAGGILSREDLAQYRVVERKPLEQQRFGQRWVSSAPPSAGGYTVLSSLGFLEQTLKPEELKTFGLERAHALIESWKGPYLDRQRYFGDPDHVKINLAALSADARQRERAARFSRERVAAPNAYDLPLPGSPKPAKPQGDRGTSHLCVVDAEGNVAAVTTTVNLVFGAGINVGGLWLNNEMDDFAREVGEDNAFGLIGGAPNLPGPKKRPVSSMSPTLVFEGDKPILCVGGSGGSRIPTAVEQVALYILQDGLHPTAAAAAPRLHHQSDPDRVDARGLPEPLVQALKQRGHNVATANFSAHVQAIRIGAEGPTRLLAGSDPNKGGEPRGE
jgi:gamma-glutamyltranspeptidase/glutathione hydrolase